MSVLSMQAREPFCTMILAHGAGAPMDSEFMSSLTQCLLELGVSVVRFEFPYMQQRRLDAVRRPPNKTAVLHHEWRRVYQEVRQKVAGPIVLAGKSMGGRMASMLADELKPCALVCFGYPFYPARKPEKPRTEHLLDLQTPTLVVQGERDALGCQEEVQHYLLAPSIQIEWMALADHDLKPLKRSGRTQDEYVLQAAHCAVDFIKQCLAKSPC